MPELSAKAGQSRLIKQKKSDKADKEESESTRNPDAQVITFAVPDICKIDKNNLKKFNDALAADGHDYELEIKTLSYDNYGQVVEGALENGKTDIAFLGFGDAAGNNPVYDLVRSDLVLILMISYRAIKEKHSMRLFQRIFGDG